MLTLYQICEIFSDGVMFPVIHYIHIQSNKLLENLHFQIFIIFSLSNYIPLS